MTPNASAFVAANAESPVVSGSVIGNGGQGARYRLADGRAFTLSANECEAVGTVRWKGINRDIPTAGRSALTRIRAAKGGE